MADDAQTETQPRPNLSTGYQRESVARSLSDTLDRGQDETESGQKPEDVEDRPNLGTVTPDDYPKDLQDH